MSTASIREIRIRVPVWPWRGRWSPETVKELRALGPAWLFTLLVPGLIACAEDRAPVFESLSMVAFVLGCAVMGALSFGHEFNHRTMGLHLSQPVSRRHLWWRKMRVLAWALVSVSVGRVISQAFFSGVLGQAWTPFWHEPFPLILFVLTVATLCVGSLARWWTRWVCIWGVVAMVAGVGAFRLITDSDILAHSHLDQLVAVGGLAIGVAFFFFCAAPMYTLLTRNTLAGAVFSLVITMAILVLASAGTTAWVRSHPDLVAEGWGTLTASEATERLLMICWSVGMGLFCVFALVVGRRKFLRMEALDSRGGDVSLPRWLTARLGRLAGPVPGARSGNLAQLIRKEVRLHQASLLLAGLLVALWGMGLVVRVAGLDLSEEATLWWVPTLSYMVLVPLLCGAVACAEERSMGTLEWHMTLPVSRRRQWLIKSLVALGLAFGLVGVLPLVLVLGWAAWGHPGVLKEISLPGVAVSWGLLLVLTSLVLYASSFARNTMKAALWGVALWCLFGAVVGVSERVVRAVTSGDFFDGGGSLVSSLVAEMPTPIASWLPWVWGGVGLWAVIGFVAVILRLGLANCRQADVSPWRLAAHLVIALGAFCGFACLALVLMALTRFLI